jgi:hypothetical protein
VNSSNTHLCQLGKLVAHRPLRELSGVCDQRPDIAVQLQAAQLAEALHSQRRVHACAAWDALALLSLQ